MPDDSTLVVYVLTDDELIRLSRLFLDELFKRLEDYSRAVTEQL